MPIPSLTTDGVLPPGVHTCTLEEIGAAFGTRAHSNQRMTLFTKLTELFALVRRSDLATAFYVDGSFITDKLDPGDIDILIALKQDHDWTRDIRPQIEYAVVDRKSLEKRFGFDIRVFSDASDPLNEYIQFFCKPNPKYHQHLVERGVVKGILQVAA